MRHGRCFGQFIAHRNLQAVRRLRFRNHPRRAPRPRHADEAADPITTRQSRNSVLLVATASSSSSPRRRFRVGRTKTGLGLFALKPFRKGDFILYYKGRLISNDEADRLGTKYLFEINNRWTIDGATKRNIARYINHSCKPNAETDVKRHKIIITAAKTIHPGDEITYNYGRNYFNAFIKPHGCRCAACTTAKRTGRGVKKQNGRRRTAKKRNGHA
jgi:hypothetical protein